MAKHHLSYWVCAFSSPPTHDRANNILEQANIDLAVNGIAFGSFIASGQTCIAATRILVQNSIKPQLLTKLSAKCESIAARMGKPTNVECVMGPLISERQLERVASLVDSAALQGVNILCGGRRLIGRSLIDDHDFAQGYYYPPTILTDGIGTRIVDTRLWKEEAFGPVIVAVGFNDEQEAVRLANDSEFGLGAALWTNDLSQAFRVSEQIEAGIVWGENSMVNQNFCTRLTGRCSSEHTSS